MLVMIMMLMVKTIMIMFLAMDVVGGQGDDVESSDHGKRRPPIKKLHNS